MNKMADTFEMTRATGRDYLDFLGDMHRKLKPDWYLEIGTQTGRSLALSSARSISVDPQFVLKTAVMGGKPELHLFQDTSDAFFAADHLKRLKATINLAFLDGMHLYEFLLRDFINTEKVMDPGGQIVLHDCLPWESSMAERDRSLAASRAWTGDVWKVIPILQKYRPDLKIRIFDAAPTGLAVVEKLNPKSQVLSRNYDKIIAEFDAVDDVEAHVSGFEVTPTEKSPWRLKPARVRAKTLHFAIQSPVPRPKLQSRWGDHYFAQGLADALERLGHTARIQTRRHWHVAEHQDEIDLVIRGRAEYAKREGHRLLYWLISVEERQIAAELAHADHVFAAGKAVTERLVRELGPERASLLPQAFDAGRMAPPAEGSEKSGILFVGIARQFERPMIAHALATGTEIELWGNGWGAGETAKWFRGQRIENEELGRHYGAAEIVLNDHTPRMRSGGLPSNRIFDALACGTAVISDRVSWIPEDLAPFVEIADDPASFQAAIARIRAESPERKAERRALALKMRETHSFDARARQIVDTLRSFTG